MEEDTGIIHWDKYQDDLDEKCSAKLKKDFIVNPHMVFQAFLLSCDLIAVSAILAFSTVRIDSHGNRFLAVSWWGLSLLFITSCLAGYILASEWKRIIYPFISMLLISICAGLLSAYITPILFDAIFHDPNIRIMNEHINSELFITLLNTIIIMLFSFAGMLVSYSKSQQE